MNPLKTPPVARSRTIARSPLSVVGLFAGIGGIELGLCSSGSEPVLLCECDESARHVLANRFPEAELATDVRSLKRLPRADLVTAGFPCQDLSQAGRAEGIGGKKSSLVGEVFRLIEASRPRPKWVLLENVSFMLSLQQGRAMKLITSSLEELGYRWAYRTVDSRSFGLPQRRQRVVLLASRSEDPRAVLFADHADLDTCRARKPTAFGFYWTEGNRGLGWVPDAVPTLKACSGWGIPSPPGIWLKSGNRIVTPDIRDAERLQGFPSDWTLPVEQEGDRPRVRWRLVGNAVSVPVSAWVGRRLAEPGTFDKHREALIDLDGSWPHAAHGRDGRVYRVDSSMWPLEVPSPPIAEFLAHPTAPLSLRAAAGFLGRARASRLRFVDGFLDAIDGHVTRMGSRASVPPRRPTRAPVTSRTGTRRPR